MRKNVRGGPPSGADAVATGLASLDMSQSELALRLGVRRSTVCRWLSGERKPSLEMALRLKAVLGISPDTWF